MKNKDLEVILEGCKVLKDRHFYKEVFEELNSIKTSSTFSEYERKQKQKVIRLLAECTYQDKELSSKVRFRQALELLSELNALDSEGDKVKTLCLKGAVYKRKYQLQKNINDLYEAIRYYEKAAKDVENDDGYGAVNTIFLYMTLIKEQKQNLSLSQIDDYEKTINETRDNALTHLNKKYSDDIKKSEWIDSTIAELYFSKGDYEEAKGHLSDTNTSRNIEVLTALSKVATINQKMKKVIERALKINVSESRDKLITIEQIIRLYKLQKDEFTETDFAFLENFFENIIAKRKVINIIQNILVGKLGLALSGGGFRASLFHLGVFSRLAELDMLKHVDVISSVSGGSIIAMNYYIKLKQLLETKTNEEIIQEDYVKLVRDMQKEFVQGIQTNIRMQAFEKFNPCEETLTHKLGELYQEELFDRAVDDLAPVKMNELYIYPKIDGKAVRNFNPHFNNFEIANKVPILVINATCINNGHNWRFTASGMGESQYMYDTTIDKNTVHKYTRYSDFKDEFKNYTVANAVAASSCVPGLFDPIELNGAYQENENLKLVDGGVYDNQGLASLLDEECKLIICSDASGQFSDDDNPSSCRLSVIPRVNNMLMDRGRDQEYEIAKEQLHNKKIDGLCILHLKQCFEVKELTPSKSNNQPTGNKCDWSDIYSGFDVEIQEALSKIRTDLDSFNDREAYALIYSGYRIMSKWLDVLKEEQPIWKSFTQKTKENWEFLRIEDVIFNEKVELLEQLKNSHSLFFKYKPWKASFPCKIFFSAGVLALLSLIMCNLFTVGLIVSVLIILNIVNKAWLYTTVKFATKPLLWVIAKFNLNCLNDKYLENGNI